MRKYIQSIREGLWQIRESKLRAEIPPFVDKLFACAETLIVSVPHKWPRGKVSGHVQDPIDIAKFWGWFVVEPRWIEVCVEGGSGLERIVGVF